VIYFREAADLNPQSRKAWTNLTICYKRLRERQIAIDCWLRVLLQEPEKQPLPGWIHGMGQLAILRASGVQSLRFSDSRDLRASGVISQFYARVGYNPFDLATTYQDLLATI
jgi:hypothetical protein